MVPIIGIWDAAFSWRVSSFFFFATVGHFSTRYSSAPINEAALYWSKRK